MPRCRAPRLTPASERSLGGCAVGWREGLPVPQAPSTAAQQSGFAVGCPAREGRWRGFAPRHRLALLSCIVAPLMHRACLCLVPQDGPGTGGWQPARGSHHSLQLCHHQALPHRWVCGIKHHSCGNACRQCTPLSSSHTSSSLLGHIPRASLPVNCSLLLIAALAMPSLCTPNTASNHIRTLPTALPAAELRRTVEEHNAEHPERYIKILGAINVDESQVQTTALWFTCVAGCCTSRGTAPGTALPD